MPVQRILGMSLRPEFSAVSPISSMHGEHSIAAQWPFEFAYKYSHRRN
jgi:hypothetical protein